MLGTNQKYTDQIYRPVNGTYVRNANEFTYPYNVLYPVSDVTTFEAPVAWKTPKCPSPFSDSNPHMRSRGGHHDMMTNTSTTTGGTVSHDQAFSCSSSMSKPRQVTLLSGGHQHSSKVVHIDKTATKKKKGCCGCCSCCESRVGEDVYNGQSDVSDVGQFAAYERERSSQIDKHEQHHHDASSARHA